MATEKPADKIKRELAAKKAAEASQEEFASERAKEELASEHAKEAEEMEEPSAGIEELRAAVAGGAEDASVNSMALDAKTRHELEQHYGEQLKSAEAEVAQANAPSVAKNPANVPTNAGMNKLYEIMADMRPSTPDNHTLFGVGNVLFTVGDLRDITGYVR